jgi:SusD family.
MKKFKKIILVSLASVAFYSCSLEEWNPSTVDLETAYKYKDGYESLINYCYDGLYYFYGKVDGIGAMEMGTDLWANRANNETGFILYNSNMTPSLGTLRTIWQGFYSTINYCNTAIYYANTVEGYTEAELKTRVAEAYFLRGWSNWHLVEQFGGVVLRTEPSTVTGPDNLPKRSSEQDFYELIISDLQYACENLPLSQAERGRVSKKAAYAMLAKVALQRVRLGDESTYSQMALTAAKELIDNQSKHSIALYQSDATQSGFEKLWAGANNKNNTEYLFTEAIDHESGKNPEGWNRGRTRQYYLMDLRTVGAVWGTTESDPLLGRANTQYFKPTKYLLTQIFEPVKNPADTRFDVSFFTEYYCTKVLEITSALATEYGKDASLVGYSIPNTVAAVTSLVSGGRNLGNCAGQVNMVDANGDGWLDGLCILTPNYTIPAAQKALLPFWVVDPSDQFTADGKWITSAAGTMGTKIMEVYPSFRKFSSPEYVYDRQYWMGDIGILRLGEIYLIAAEAALRLNDQNTAAGYVNDIRKRAAILPRQNEMVVANGTVTLDFILAERARELVGEQTRWYDLKRMGKLTKEYLAQTNPDILTFDPAKHTVRPIPQSYLDAITNPDEFGNNGY